MIRFENVHKRYPGGREALAGVSFALERGEMAFLTGPSGAGKSTLLHIMGMHDSAWTGEYWLFDDPVHQHSAKERMRLQKQHVGFVFQSYHLLDNLTVYENLEVPLSYRDVPRAQRQSIVSDVLDRFQIVLWNAPVLSASARRDRGAVSSRQPRACDQGRRGFAGRRHGLVPGTSSAA